jgi:uncharacterized protein YndB with AHSA1/START domain
MSEDKIEKQIVLKASMDRVWNALADSQAFGTWFGMKIEGPFETGKTVKAVITPTKVDPEVAEQQKPYEGVEFELCIEDVKPNQRLAFRWHPYKTDDDKDLWSQPSTLVSFNLTQQPDGIHLTVTEEGFQNIPLDLRAKAFASNCEGWAIQVQLIGKYLAHG